MTHHIRFRGILQAAGVVLFGALAVAAVRAQQPPRKFGGAYAELDQRRQQLVTDMVARLSKVSGQPLEAGAFYDDIIPVATKTTFDAVTQALMTTPLTDASGQKFGDGLSLVERIDAVRGEVPGTSGDRQFRMYVRLTPNAREMMERSQEFKRGVDNTVYHKGYPYSYRQQGGSPSIQVSIALDGRQADVDVDYRSSSFPAMLFNGHLSAANSDVRAGDNADRHAQRWAGFENWWRGFFGVRVQRSAEAPDPRKGLGPSRIPRAGKKDIQVMVPDFLRAWLVEGDAMAAMGYVSDRAYACLAQDAPDPSAFDRGVAPLQMMNNLKAVHETVGKHDSLEGLTVGVRLANPALRVVPQPHQAQFVIYQVRDDVAARFDCESRLTPGPPKKASREYGHYLGSTFYIAGPGKSVPIALLWAKEDGYWKIVSWQADPEPDEEPIPAAPAEPGVVRIKADPTLVRAAKDLLDAWLIRKDYAAAFRYLSAKSYGCYDLERDPALPASASLDEAGQRIRAGLERAGQWVGTAPTLDAMVEAVEPIHSSIRVMDHPHSREFSLASLPNAIGDAVECDARARGAVLPDPLPLDYGEAFAMLLRFRTQGGDAPVLRLLWRKEAGAWRVTAYQVEMP